MQRHPQTILSLHLDAQGVILQPNVGLGQSHIQSIEDLLHDEDSGSGLNSERRKACNFDLAASASGWQMSLSEHLRQRSSFTGGGSTPLASIMRRAITASSTACLKAGVISTSRRRREVA